MPRLGYVGYSGGGETDAQYKASRYAYFKRLQGCLHAALTISHKTCRRPTRGGITPSRLQHEHGTRGSEPVANQEEGHGKPPPRTDVPRKRQWQQTTINHHRKEQIKLVGAGQSGHHGSLPILRVLIWFFLFLVNIIFYFCVVLANLIYRYI